MKKIILISLSLLLFTSCSCSSNSTLNPSTSSAPSALKEEPSDKDLFALEWADYYLEDVLTGGKFSINNNYEEVPILISSFAVWCPTCKKQQKYLKDYRDTVDASVVIISLDTDSNEDAETVKKYAEENKFDWHFVISPSEVTQALVDQFGTSVVNPPMSPVVLVCPDQAAYLLDSGLKEVSDLRGLVSEKCS